MIKELKDIKQLESKVKSVFSDKIINKQLLFEMLIVLTEIIIINNFIDILKFGKFKIVDDCSILYNRKMLLQKKIKIVPGESFAYEPFYRYENYINKIKISHNDKCCSIKEAMEAKNELKDKIKALINNQINKNK